MSCKFRLLYHIILVVKYRKKLLLTYGDFIKEIIIELTDRYKSNVFWSKGYFINLIGILVKKLLEIILIIKAKFNFSSTFFKRKEFPKLSNYYE